MKFREPAKLHRKSGVVGHPALVAGLESEAYKDQINSQREPHTIVLVQEESFARGHCE